MNHKCDHEENRSKVCAPCGKKVISPKYQSKLKITDKLEKLIQKYVDKTFTCADSKFPLSICTSCRLALLDREKNITTRPLQLMPNYKDITLTKSTRNNDGLCNCYICLTGRLTNHSKVIKGRGKKRELNNKIDESNGLNGSSSISQLPVNKKLVCDSTNSYRICEKCLQKIGKGINHSCDSSSATHNLIKLVEKLPEKNQEQLLTSVLKNKVETCNSSNNTLEKDELELSNFSGRKTRIALNPPRKTEVKFTVEDLTNLKVNTRSSANHMRKINNFLRSKLGRKSIPTNIEKQISLNSKKVEDIYHEDLLEFDTGKTEKQMRPVIWANAEELLEAVIRNRDLTGEIKIKVMADGGQGFFKISMSVFQDPNSSNLDVDFDDTAMSHKKKYLCSEGGSSAKKMKLTSVHRLVLLCIVPDIKETYENIEILFKLIDINKIPFKVVSDIKVLLIINGQQTASASYPCPFCFVSLKDLKNSQKSNNIESLNDSMSSCELDNSMSDNEFPTVSDACMKLKTFKDLKDDYNTFCLKGKKKKYAKECHSTVNFPLLDEDGEVYVIEKCLVPELHIMQGFVNHLFWTGLVPLLGREKALLWPHKLHLIPKNYQGDVFEGNACRELLRNADALLDIDICESIGSLKLVPFISAFKAMDKIVNCCFSTSMGSDLDSYLIELSQAFECTDVSESLKIHVVLNHLTHCLHFLNGDGLGLWSEQSGESIHRDFLTYWNRYKINSVQDDAYVKKLKKAVIEFSSEHL